MDGSILSEARLLEASRSFVCARLVTYEDAEEGEYLKMIGGSTKLEVANTTFVLLAPDGRTPLTRAGRAPRQTFNGPEGELDGLLSTMQEISEQYPGNGEAIGEPVPYAADVKRALNVAACDNQPLVVFSLKDESRREEIEQMIAGLAWSPEFRGRFAFVKSDSISDFETIDNVPANATDEDLVFVTQPGTYGLTGNVISVATQLNTEGLQEMLQNGLSAFDKEPMSRQQLRAGKRNGIGWDAEDIEARVELRSSRRGGGNNRGR